MDKLTEIIGKLFNIEKAPTQLIGVIFVASTSMIFLPEKLLNKLKLLKFQREYDVYIGPICALTGLFLFFAFSKFIYDKSLSKVQRFQENVTINNNLKNLTIHEKRLIREFFIQSKHTIYAPVMNDTVISLESKMIIYKASNSGLETIAGIVWAYNLDKLAFQKLTLDILGLKDNPTEQEKDIIISERPQWVGLVERLKL